MATKLRTLRSHDNAVSAPCPHFGPCGGCTLQNLEYAAQLTAKREWVVSALQRIGGFTLAESLVTPVIPCRWVSLRLPQHIMCCAALRVIHAQKYIFATQSHFCQKKAKLFLILNFI